MFEYARQSYFSKAGVDAPVANGARTKMPKTPGRTARYTSSRPNHPRSPIASLLPASRRRTADGSTFSSAVRPRETIGVSEPLSGPYRNSQALRNSRWRSGWELRKSVRRAFVSLDGPRQRIAGVTRSSIIQQVAAEQTLAAWCRAFTQPCIVRMTYRDEELPTSAARTTSSICAVIPNSLLVRHSVELSGS